MSMNGAAPRSEKGGHRELTVRTSAGHMLQPFNLRAGALFVATGVGLYFYFRSEKEKVQQKKRS